MRAPRRTPAATRAAVAGVLLLAATSAAGRSWAADVADAPGVRLELVDGSVADGGMRSLEPDAVGIAASDGERRVPLADIRRLVLVHRRAAPAAMPMRLDAVDGTSIDGDDFLWQGETATVRRGDVRIDMPIQRVRRVTWRDPAAAVPPWIAALPDDPEQDMVVVTSGDGSEVVDCAITAVSPEAVTVVLDGETIPVRRAKVAGLVWSRRPVAEVGARVGIEAGRLAGRVVTLRGSDLVVDETTRVPLELVESIDFAAARSVCLVDLEPERRSTEPFVGELAGIGGVAAFFAPRVVSAAPDSHPAGSVGGPRALLVRPRTATVWRVPEAARRFRATVARAAGARPGAAVRVAVRLDDRPAWEALLDATRPAGAELDVEVAGAGRLELVVDFVGLDPGCPVLLAAAVFER